MDQERDGERVNRAWPWLVLLVVAGLIALAVVMWQPDTVRLILGADSTAAEASVNKPLASGRDGRHRQDR